jgi:DNA (cytosine-5)-methyltransferase 1
MGARKVIRYDKLVLEGGSPCQAFSIAGKRLGLGDCRGDLTLRFVELA